MMTDDVNDARVEEENRIEGLPLHAQKSKKANKHAEDRLRDVFQPADAETVTEVRVKGRFPRAGSSVCVCVCARLGIRKGDGNVRRGVPAQERVGFFSGTPQWPVGNGRRGVLQLHGTVLYARAYVLK